MPPKKSKRADVGSILESTNFLPCCLANGMMLWLLSARVGPGQRPRGVAVATMRILCKDMREAVDKELDALMRRLVARIARARECAMELRRTQRLGYNQNDINREHAKQDEALKSIIDITTPCFGEMVSKQIVTDLTKFSGITTGLLPHPGTFLAMAQQRCQISLSQPNVCSLSHMVVNFTELRTPERTVCVYSRPKAIERMLVYQSQFLQRAGNNRVERDKFDLAREMLRMREVFFPCTNAAILQAINWNSAQPPTCLFVEKHPCLDPLTSLEGLLHLTPDETRRAKAAVAFARQQEDERKRKIMEMDRAQMTECMDEYIRRSGHPGGIRSLEQLGKSHPGMEKCLRVITSKLQPGHLSPIDSPWLRNAYKTASSFLCDVCAAQKKLSGGCSSASAYEFVSGMHVGHYNELFGAQRYECRAWPLWHDGLHLCVVPHNDSAFRSIDAAMRFFDSLGCAKLERAAQTPMGMVPTYRLSAGGVTVVFAANWVPSWDACWEMQQGIRRLVRDFGLRLTESDVPLLSKSEYTSYRRLRAANEVEYMNPCFNLTPKEEPTCRGTACNRYVIWTEEVFQMLVSEPATRCGALNVAGLHTSVLLEKLAAPDVSE